MGRGDPAEGSETDQTTVDKIREAIREQKEVTVQLINYTKSGKKFWNLFHLQPMWVLIMSQSFPMPSDTI
ncbi:hypothetical protein ZWY2020_011893 [Hordeum vulgare]|nr:hypothetical protein ZWY2020_011893 [Hordeum vulgare]